MTPLGDERRRWKGEFAGGESGEHWTAPGGTIEWLRDGVVPTLVERPAWAVAMAAPSPGVESYHSLEASWGGYHPC